MYNIIKNNRLRQALESLPTIREVNFSDVIEIRRKTGQGCYICKLLAQKSQDNEHAIELFKYKMNEIVTNNGK